MSNAKQMRSFEFRRHSSRVTIAGKEYTIDRSEQTLQWFDQEAQRMTAMRAGHRPVPEQIAAVKESNYHVLQHFLGSEAVQNIFGGTPLAEIHRQDLADLSMYVAQIATGQRNVTS